MADINNSIALQTQTPSFVTTLSNLLNVKQQQLGLQQGQQTLQQGQQTLESQELNLQAARQSNQERKNWIDLIQQDPALHPRDDGTIDTGPDNVAKIMKAMPQTWGAKVQDIAKSNNDIVAARQSLQNLNKDAAGMVSKAVKSLDGASPSEYAAVANLQKKQSPDTAPYWDALVGTLGKAKANADELSGGDPKASSAAVSSVLKTFSNMPLDVQTQNTLKTPQYNDVGSVYKQINPSSPAIDIIKTVMPGDSFKEDPVTHQLMVVRVDKNNNIIASRAASEIGAGTPGPAKPNAPNAPGPAASNRFTAIPPGETADTFSQLQADRKASNDAASATGLQASNNRQILDLMKAGTTTGSNAKAVQTVFNTIGIPWKTDEATNLNQISHYVSQQTQENEKAMGVRTDAGRETSKLASAPVEFNSPAFVSAVKANDATTSGMRAHNIGMENAVQQGGPAAIRAFKNAWSNSYDPVVYRYANALRDGDGVEKLRIEQQYNKPASGKPIPPNSDWGMFVGKMAKLHELEGQ